MHNFTVLQNIVLGMETVKRGFLKMDDARKKVVELSERYGLYIDPDALIEDITVGMQQRVEILKMLYRDNEIMIFDEPTAVLTPQEIDELMQIMKNLVAEGNPSSLSPTNWTKSRRWRTGARCCAAGNISERWTWPMSPRRRCPR